nr:MAG TPA: hypothetical protein [Caudoviricetes sp.]
MNIKKCCAHYAFLCNEHNIFMDIKNAIENINNYALKMDKLELSEINRGELCI